VPALPGDLSGNPVQDFSAEFIPIWDAFQMSPTDPLSAPRIALWLRILGSATAHQVDPPAR
jgi:hypothetical protein